MCSANFPAMWFIEKRLIFCYIYPQEITSTSLLVLLLTFESRVIRLLVKPFKCEVFFNVDRLSVTGFT